VILSNKFANAFVLKIKFTREKILSLNNKKE